MCQNTAMPVYGAWIKRYCVLCLKTYNTLHSCHNFPAGSRQAARGVCICEISLFHPTFYNVCNYLSVLGLKLNHVSKKGCVYYISLLQSHSYYSQQDSSAQSVYGLSQ